ncbi:hypothetical protein E2562_008011 [Oryza meyeriana var. granulata]|uniref:Uncharacterized protein n=1 Tax=Oryza meyeriana var. granulata TaxID=110450 RepID=A0A6G1DFN3_9ORYZ|nr:hypothetical protein E2562_008011 [Oryza meyeriana var. granulata]
MTAGGKVRGGFITDAVSIPAVATAVIPGASVGETLYVLTPGRDTGTNERKHDAAHKLSYWSGQHQTPTHWLLPIADSS